MFARPGAGERPGGHGGSGGLLADLDALELGVGDNELAHPLGLAVLLVLADLEEPGQGYAVEPLPGATPAELRFESGGEAE